MSDLDELERLAKAAQKVWFSNVPLPELRAYHDASRPEAVLSLVARVREAEAVIDQMKQWAEDSVDARYGTLSASYVIALLSTYEKGATQ